MTVTTNPILEAAVGVNTRTRAIEIAGRIRTVGTAARKNFVQRDEFILMLERCSVAGEHGIVLGPPGTGKSAAVKFFGKSLGMTYFRKALNADIRREDLVGPINPQAIQQGKWDRAWLGLATSQFVFLDEIGRATGPVTNMTLDAMEERETTSGDTVKQVPLHSLFSASNSTLEEDQAATFDRFSCRCVVGYIDNSKDFIKFLTSRQQAQDMPQVQHITEEELAILKHTCELMAWNISEEVQTAMADLWSGIKTITNNRVSDRRWEFVLILAAANALLEGRPEIGVRDLSVASMIIWHSVTEIDKIKQFVNDTVNKEEVVLRTMETMITGLETDLISANIDQQARINLNAGKMMREVLASKKSGNPKWLEMETRLQAIKDKIEA